MYIRNNTALAAVVATASIISTHGFIINSFSLAYQQQQRESISSTTILEASGADTRTKESILEKPTTPTSSSSSGPDMKAWARGFTTCPQEMTPTLISIPELPSDFPTGTYYRNGHARFEADDGTKVLHPFDGDGMILAITFDNEQANNNSSSNTKNCLFRNKFVNTKGYKEDKRTGKMSERGIFGTMKSGGILSNMFDTSQKNVANTHVVHCKKNNELYALWEGGLPYLLDPLSLENKMGPGEMGECDLGGICNGKRSNNIAAHYRYDPRNKSYVNFSVKFDPASGNSKVTLYDLDEETFRLRSINNVKSCPSFVSKGPGLIHDFALTENYCIFNINQCSLNGKNGFKALLGLSGFASAIDIDACATETSIVLIPRRLFGFEEDEVTNMDFETDERITVIKVPNHFNFHYGNAFEDDQGNVVFDTAQTTELSLEGMSSGLNEPIWDKPDVFDSLVPNTLVRYTLDVENKCLLSTKTLSTRIPEFPSFPKELSTRKHRYLYPVAARKDIDVLKQKVGSAPVGAVQKVDTEYPEFTETFVFEPYEFPGETAFVTKKGRDVTQPNQEDAGYLIVIIVNGKDMTTDLAIFDVEGKGSLEKGPILRQTLPVFLPHMLHGGFFEGVTFDFKQVTNYQ